MKRFDLAQLRKHLSLDEDVAHDLIVKFCDKASMELIQLQRCLLHQEWDEMRRVAKELQDAAGYVCADRFGQLATELEQLASEARTEQVYGVLQELLDEQQLCMEWARQRRHESQSAAPEPPPPRYECRPF